MLENARTTIARLVECKSDDIVFTSGATDANALAILGRVRAARAGGLEHSHVLYLPSAHASVVENMKLVENESADIEALPIKNCRVDCDALAKLLRPETVLVSMDAVCGETGVIWNTREVACTLEKSGHPMSRGHRMSTFRPVLHVDASQATWTQKLTRAHFGADLMTLDASKVCETRGIGCLVVSRTTALAPLYGGGGQERGLRPGSEASDLAAAFAEGLSRAAEGRAHFCAEASAARAELVKAIRAGVPDVLINESSGGFVSPHVGTYETPASQAPHILNLSLTRYDTDYIVALLDEAGFAVSTRSACETDSKTGSRSVFALWGDATRAVSTLRISWGPTVGTRALAQFPQALIQAVRFIDSAGVT